MHQAALRGVANKKHKKQPGKALRVRVVVSELRQPGSAPLRWVLLTNLSDAAVDLVGAYLLRWPVERLFWLEKIGFRLECWHQENAQDPRTAATGFPVLKRRGRRPWEATPDAAALSPMRKITGLAQIGYNGVCTPDYLAQLGSS